MEEFLKIPAFQQVPGLIVMGFMVMAFLKYLAGRDQAFSDMHKEHIQAREATQRVLELSAQATRENADATRNNTRAIDDLRQSINHSNPKHH